jgi:hypothetical protein
MVLAACLAAFLIAAPFAAHAAGSWAYAASARRAQAQRATLRQVPATLLQAPSRVLANPGAGYAPTGVDARWRAPDGQVRTGILSPPLAVLPAGAAARATIPVWVDWAGRLADPPLGHTQLAVRAYLAEGAAVGALAIALIAACWLVRWALNRRRMAAWDADWLAIAPRWRPRS